jgi:hypothetical protein
MKEGNGVPSFQGAFSEVPAQKPGSPKNEQFHDAVSVSLNNRTHLKRVRTGGKNGKMGPEKIYG